MQLSVITSILHEMKPFLMEKYGVSSLGIFGSAARGDFREESDVDIIVDFKKPIGIEFIDLAEEIENRIPHKVDLVSRNGIKERYLQVIEPEIVYV